MPHMPCDDNSEGKGRWLVYARVPLSYQFLVVNHLVGRIFVRHTSLYLGLIRLLVQITVMNRGLGHLTA